MYYTGRHGEWRADPRSEAPSRPDADRAGREDRPASVGRRPLGARCCDPQLRDTSAGHSRLRPRALIPSLQTGRVNSIDHRRTPQDDVGGAICRPTGEGSFPRSVAKRQVGICRCLKLFPFDRMTSSRSSRGTASVTSSLEDWQRSCAVRRTSPEMSMSHHHETGRICAGSRPHCENSTRRCEFPESMAPSNFHLTSTLLRGERHGPLSQTMAIWTSRCSQTGLGDTTICGAARRGSA